MLLYIEYEDTLWQIITNTKHRELMNQNTPWSLRDMLTTFQHSRVLSRGY